jgi:hypothetical protein
MVGTGEIFVGSNFDDSPICPFRQRAVENQGWLFPIPLTWIPPLTGSQQPRYLFGAAARRSAAHRAGALTDTRGAYPARLGWHPLSDRLLPAKRHHSIQIESAGSREGEVIWAGTSVRFIVFQRVEFGLKRAEVGGTIYEPSAKSILSSI